MLTSHAASFRVTGTLATVAVVLSVVAFMFAFTGASSPCAAHAQTTQCSIGDDEVFTGEIQVGATPTGGNSGELMISQGANASPEWTPYAVYKPADETVNNSTVLQDDDDFSFAVVANATYAVSGVLYNNTGTTPDFKMQWSLPAGASFDGTTQNNTNNGSNSQVTWLTEATTSAIVQNFTDYAIAIHGTLIVAGTAGNATLQWAQNLADASDTKVQQGSWISIHRIN